LRHDFLASGLRINYPGDDPAGLTLASGLNTGARIYAQAVKNLNDGLSAVAIAEGAMNEFTSITTRIQELAVQSSNGVYSDEQ
jgi:flagellin